MEKILLTLAIVAMLSILCAAINVLSASQIEGGTPPCGGPRRGGA